MTNTTATTTTHARARDAYLAAGGSPEHETAVLSIGSDLLPPEAIAVRDGRVTEPSSDYWAWLTAQLTAQLTEDAVEVDPLADLAPEEAADAAGAYVMIGVADWGLDEPVPPAEHAAAIQRMEDWLTEHEGPRLDIRVRDALRGEAAGIYRVVRGGHLQILGYSVRKPEVVSNLLSQAWEHACETWPREESV